MGTQELTLSDICVLLQTCFIYIVYALIFVAGDDVIKDQQDAKQDEKPKQAEDKKEESGTFFHICNSTFV